MLAASIALTSCSGSSSPTNSGSAASADTSDVFADDNIATEPGTAPLPEPVSMQRTRVTFTIEVPAYQSDTLTLELQWGDTAFTAQWVGDEIWSASADLNADTEATLRVQFFDRNGAIPIAAYETNYRTGTGDAEDLRITAAQFDTDQFDSDQDGISNLDELIAGSFDGEAVRLLLFSETRGFRHNSIDDAVQALEELAAEAGMQTVHANDSGGVFTTSNLASFDAVAWVLTSGDVLDIDEQAAFERFVQSGGGYAGIHAASDTEYAWPWYGGLVGAYFARHPRIQSATQIVENRTHPSTAHLQATWTRTDEWYDFRRNPRSDVNVLMRLDESSYSGGGMGEDHPITWYHAYDGGRSWYTGGGHTSASYSEPDFRAHLKGGLRYATGQLD